MSVTPPSPHPPTPTVIDHLAFPQIIDAIVAHASPPSLRALRAVSSEYKRRVDAILFHHVIISTNADIIAPHGRLPGLRWTDPSASVTERAGWVDTLRSHARILDYDQPIYISQLEPQDVAKDVHKESGGQGHDPQLFAALGNITVARRTMQTRWVIPSPKTVVDFVHLAACQSPNQRHPTLYEHDGPHLTWSWPRSMKRVLCIKYTEQGSLVSRRHLAWLHEERPTNMTIILSLNDHPSPPTAAHQTMTAWSPQEFGILTPLVLELGKHVSHCSYTIVGVLEMQRHLLGLARDADDSAVELVILEGIRRAFDDNYSHSPTTQEARDRIARAIRIQSLADYRAEVGNDQFELHTMCPRSAPQQPPQEPLPR